MRCRGAGGANRRVLLSRNTVCGCSVLIFGRATYGAVSGEPVRLNSRRAAEPLTDWQKSWKGDFENSSSVSLYLVTSESGLRERLSVVRD